jgi:polyphosphate kinase 2
MSKSNTKKTPKKRDDHDNVETAPDRSTTPAEAEGEASAPGKLKRKEYEREMRVLQGELVAMQEWVKTTGARVCVIFEGVDSAGKGGTIRRITERTSPRVFKHIALPAPDARVRSQMYVQRYIAHFPSAGEVVIFDRSWYNRAGVEPVMGYCTPKQTKRFLEMVPQVEKAMVDDGIILIKYFLNVGREEQTRRLESRIDDPRKVWKLSPTDLKSYARRYEYLRARDAMFVATSTSWAPWHIADNDDKKRGRLNIISHLLSQIPYEPLAPPEAKMPKPPRHDGYVEPDSSKPNIPTPFEGGTARKRPSQPPWK